MKIQKLMVAVLGLGVALAVSVRADDAPPKPEHHDRVHEAPHAMPPASTKEGVTYATDIKPIFDNSCIKCHGKDRAKAKLHLDSLEGVLAGSEDGKVLKPGNSADSVLVKAVSYATKDDDMWMPPQHNKAGIKPLTAEEVGLIRAWIDQGAK
ncbi:MAG TPA: c-type cytochrome domain-containing protein [Dongiaceae bacterium]|nr:c-type cytochrome domain-containing protein [Dongiaceae bacterium]